MIKVEGWELVRYMKELEKKQQKPKKASLLSTILSMLLHR
jgi:hypothetical protein